MATTTAVAAESPALTSEILRQAIAKLPPIPEPIERIRLGPELMDAVEKISKSVYVVPGTPLNIFGMRVEYRPDLFPEGGEVMGAIVYQNHEKPVCLITRGPCWQQNKEEG